MDEESEWADAQEEEEAEEEFAYSSDERPFADQDDEDDVDWENVDGDGDGQVQDEDAAEEDSDSDHGGGVQVDWQALNASLERVHKRKRRPAARRMTKEEKQREFVLHQSHLLLLLAAQTKWNKVCQQSALLRGLLLSLTAGNSAAVDFYTAFRSSSSSDTTTYLMELLVRWFNEEFRLRAAPTEASDERALSESRLMQAFYARQGSHLELTLLFVMLCRAVDVRCRLTCALDPLLVQHTKAFEATSTQGGISPGNKKRRRRNTSAQATGNEAVVVSSEPVWIWCEVLDSKHSSWLHVDPVRRLVNHTEQVEEQRGKGAPVSYVMSIDEHGHWMDVSARYAAKWSKTIKLRLAHDWIQRCLSQLNLASAASANEKHSEVIRELEAQQLEVKTQHEEFPTSLEGFKKHHLYCLERHLARNECIHPRKPVGLFKGQAVFMVKDKQVLLPARRWQRLGRVIKPEEQANPAKRRSDGKNKRQNDGDTDDDDEPKRSSTTQDGESTDPNAALYGQWQTTEFIPEPVVDGRVPKNQYGNIELWSQAHIPRGAVHLQLPRIDTLARDLGVDFAPAVVGFEVKNGKTYPKMDGIVVAASAQEMLLDAHAHLQQTTIEQAIAKNQKIVLRRWEKLTKRLLLQNRLNEDYGHTKARSHQLD